MTHLTGQAHHNESLTIKNFYNFAALKDMLLTHGVIGNTSGFGSEESWFEPRWVNKEATRKRGFFVEWPEGEETGREACPDMTNEVRNNREAQVGQPNLKRKQ